MPARPKTEHFFGKNFHSLIPPNPPIDYNIVKRTYDKLVRKNKARVIPNALTSLPISTLIPPLSARQPYWPRLLGMSPRFAQLSRGTESGDMNSYHPRMFLQGLRQFPQFLQSLGMVAELEPVFGAFDP